MNIKAFGQISHGINELSQAWSNRRGENNSSNNNSNATYNNTTVYSSNTNNNPSPSYVVADQPTYSVDPSTNTTYVLGGDSGTSTAYDTSGDNIVYAPVPDPTSIVSATDTEVYSSTGITDVSSVTTVDDSGGVDTSTVIDTVTSATGGDSGGFWSSLLTN